MPPKPLADQVLEAWRVNNGINVLLIEAVPAKGLSAVPLASRGRNVARQLAHMHKVRFAWLRHNGAAGKLKPFPSGSSPTRAQLKAGFRASGAAVERFLRDVMEGRTKLKMFRGQPVRWMSYLIAHESHHRGQIALALKQNGMRLPDKVAITGLWFKWYYGEPL